MKKRFAVMAISIMAVLSLSSCYPTGKDMSSPSFESTHFNGSHFEYSKDELSVGFDIPEIPDELPSRIKFKEKKFDHQKVVELFFGGEAPVSEYLYGVNKDHGQYTAQDGSKVTIEGNSISYSDGKVPSSSSLKDLNFPVSYSSVGMVCKEYYRDFYSITEDELEGFPLQGALDSARELIEKLGLTGYGEPRIYSISLAVYENIKQNEAYMFNEEAPLTKDNEIYYFEFPRLLGGIDLSDMRWVSIKDSTSEWDQACSSASIIVGVSKEGIFEFYVEAAYEEEVEVLSTEPIKYDLNHAISELENYLDKASFTRSNSTVINNARVIYYPVERNEANTMEYVPAWSFEGYGCDWIFAEMLDNVHYYDFRYLVRTDVGVIMEYNRE